MCLEVQLTEPDLQRYTLSVKEVILSDALFATYAPVRQEQQVFSSNKHFWPLNNFDFDMC